MLPEKRIPSHPDEILVEEFLRPLEVTQVAFAQALGTSPEFWLYLQAAHDLARNRPSLTVKRLPAAASI